MKNSEKPATASAFTLGRGNYAETTINTGLTKREAFAMAAMQGLLSDSDRGGRCEAYARDAIKFADALLKELDKE